MPTVKDLDSPSSTLVKRINVKHLIDKSKELNAFVPWFSAILGTILFFAILGFILEQLGCLKSEIKARPKRRGSRSTIKQSKESLTVGEQVLYDEINQSSYGDNVLKPSQRQKRPRTSNGPPAEGRSMVVKGKNGPCKRLEKGFASQKESEYSGRRWRDKSESKYLHCEGKVDEEKSSSEKRYLNARKKEKLHKTYSRGKGRSGYGSYIEKYEHSGGPCKDNKLYGRYKKHDGSVGHNRDDECGQYGEKQYRAVGRHKENRLYGRCKQERSGRNYKETTSKRQERAYGKREMKHDKRPTVRPSRSDAVSPGRNPVGEGMTMGKRKAETKGSTKERNMSIGRRNTSKGDLSTEKRCLSKSELRAHAEEVSRLQEDYASSRNHALHLENEREL